MFVRTSFVRFAARFSLALMTIGVAIVAGPVLGSAAHACDGQQHAAAPTCADDAAAPAQDPGAAAGMRATIDPATGRLTDNPAPAAQISGTVAGQAPLPEVRLLPNGTSILNTRGLMHTMTATASPDGLPKTDCVQGRHEPEK